MVLLGNDIMFEVDDKLDVDVLDVVVVGLVVDLIVVDDVVVYVVYVVVDMCLVFVFKVVFFGGNDIGEFCLEVMLLCFIKKYDIFILSFILEGVNKKDRI